MDLETLLQKRERESGNSEDLPWCRDDECPVVHTGQENRY